MNLEKVKESQTTKFYSAEVASYDKKLHTAVFYLFGLGTNYRDERINPDGVRFVAKPKLQINHDYNIPPPGWIQWVGKDAYKWKIGVEFDQKDPNGVLYEWKYSQGMMTDISAGFRPNYKTITEDPDGTLVFNDILVTEISLVNIGADPGAKILTAEDCNICYSLASDESVKKYYLEMKKKIDNEITYKNELDELKSRLIVLENERKSGLIVNENNDMKEEQILEAIDRILFKK